MEYLAKDYIDYLRIYKHDILNYLQVIIGYLQINKPELAKKYVKEAISEIQFHGSVMNLGLPNLAFWLLIQQVMLKEKGIDLIFKCNADFSNLIKNENTLINLFDKAEKIISCILETKTHSQEWQIRFQCMDNNNYKIIFKLPELNNSWNKKLDFLYNNMIGIDFEIILY